MYAWDDAFFQKIMEARKYAKNKYLETKHKTCINSFSFQTGNVPPKDELCHNSNPTELHRDF
jgi:hypothetical protein